MKKPRTKTRKMATWLPPFKIGDYVTCVAVTESTITSGITKGKVLKISSVVNLGDGTFGVNVTGKGVRTSESGRKVGWMWYADRFKKVEK
jgi:hypothetical protein